MLEDNENDIYNFSINMKGAGQYWTAKFSGLAKKVSKVRILQTAENLLPNNCLLRNEVEIYIDEERLKCSSYDKVTDDDDGLDWY